MLPKYAPPMSGAELERIDVSIDGLDVAALSIGSGPLAICLHGFPDSAHTWRHLMPRLADAGYRAVAPWMRGYAPTSVPVDGVYQTARLGLDAIALHDALGGDDRAVVIGHDWGAPAAYAAAILAPERWSRVVGMSVPPWGAIGRAFVGNLEQLHRSWYMFFFQHPLSEFVVGANDHAFIERLWRHWSPALDAPDDVARAKACLADAAHLGAALGYYRAALGTSHRDPALDQAQQHVSADSPGQPVLYLHGADDGCIGVEVARDAAAHAPANARVEIVEGAGHFLHLERPDAVADSVLAFLDS